MWGSRFLHGLIAQIVLDAGPHIHRRGAELDFDGHGGVFAMKADGHEHHQMQAAIAARLRRGDIIPHGEKLPRGRRAQKVGKVIHGLYAGEHDAQAGDVVQAGCALRALRQTAARQLIADGCGRFQPERHRADGEGRLFFLELHPRRAECEKRGFHRRLIGRVKRKIKSGLLRRAHLL